MWRLDGTKWELSFGGSGGRSLELGFDQGCDFRAYIWVWASEAQTIGMLSICRSPMNKGQCFLALRNDVRTIEHQKPKYT